MKIKTFILTFLLVMSCPFLFGQSRAGETPVTTYDGIISAIKQSQESGNLVQIYLKSNVEVANQILIPENAKISIDLNDFVLSSPSDVYIFKNLGELTITDNSQYGGGAIESKCIENGDGKLKAQLTMKDVTFKNAEGTNGGALVYNKVAAEATIDGGSYEGNNIALLNYGVMTVTNVARIEGKSQNFKIYEGSTLNISKSYIYGNYYQLIGSATVGTTADDEVIEGEGVMFVKATVGGKPYASLHDAVVAANDKADAETNQTVELLYDVVETQIVEAKFVGTINGNNKTLTSTAGKAINVNVACAEDEVVTINNLTIATTDNANFRTERAINVINDANLELNNVSAEGFKYTINVTNSGAGSNIRTNGGKYSGYAAVNITGNDTKFTSKDTEFVGVNNVAQHESNNFAAIAVNYPTTENVTININGGKVSATSTTGNRQFIATVENTTKSTITIDAELAPINNDIFNGDFEGENTIAFRDDYADKLLAQGYTFEGVEDNEGLVAVTGIAVAKIGDTYYNSLKDALVAVTNDQKIEIVANNDEGTLTYPITDDNEYAINFSITTKEGFEYEFAESNYGLVFTSGVKVTFVDANIKGIVNSFGNETVITLAGNNNIKTLQSVDGGTYSVAEGEQKIGTLQGELKVSGEPTLAIEEAGVGSKLVINGATLNDVLPANIDVTVAQGENNVINTAINGGNFVVAENTAVTVNADMTDLASLTVNGTMNAEANVKVNTAEGNTTTINGKFSISGEGKVASIYRSVTVGGKVNVNAGATFTQSNKNYSFNLNNGAEINVAEGSVITVGAVKVAAEAAVALKFKGNASFKSTTNAGTINLYMKEGTTFTTNNIDDTDDTDGVSFVATTDDNCEIFYEEGAYKAIRILNDGDVAMIGKVGYQTLQAAIDACTTPGDYTIVLLRDIAETSVEIDQTKDINITIDGGEETRYNFSGTMCIHGKSNYTYTETLKIKNIDFYNENLTAAHDFISSNDAHDGHVRYAHNVTIENCNFSVPAETEYDVVAMRFRQAFNISVIGGEFKNLHSVMWTTGTSGVKFDGIAATDCKNGMHIGGGSNGVIVNNSSLDVENYGIRAEGQGKDFSIDGSTIKATIPVVVRKTNEVGSPNFTFGDNTMTPNNSYNYWFVAGIEEYEGGETLPTIAGQVVVNIEEDSNLSYEGVYGSYCVAKIGETQYQSLELALQAVKDGQTIEIIGKEGDKEPAAINYDGEGKEFTITSAEGSMYSFGGNKITLANATVNLDNANINGIVVASTGATVNIKGTTYVKTLMSEGTGIYSVNGATFNVGTLMSDVNVSGKSTLTVDAYTSGTLYANEVTLDENTILPTGVKVEFVNTNTVNNTSLKGNIVFNNGTTTFEGASLTGSVNVKDGATVDFTKNTYLNTTGNGQSVIVAGTLKINASGAWATTVNVAETGKLNIEGRNEIDNTYLGNNDLNVRGTLTNNGKITIGSESMVTIASAVSGSELDGTGTLTIAGTAKVDALNVAIDNIANTILLNGADAKFYAPVGLTNVFDADGIQEPTYIEKGEEEEDYGYYSLGGTYVAKIVKDGKTYQFRTIKSALASDHFNGEITLINDTKEDNFNINKNVIFKTEPESTEPGSTINIASKAYVSANKTLTIAEGANIQFNYLTNMGTVTNKGKLVVKATLENKGTFNNNAAATITAETLVNAADVTFNNNGTLKAATVTNNGTISNAAESSLTVNGTLTNNGTITNNGTLSATTFTNGNIFNNGTANNNSGEADFESVENSGTINNYATLTVTKFTKNGENGENGVQLYAGSINVTNSLSEINGNFVVYSTTLDEQTVLTGANITFANDEESSINGATLTNSNLNVNINHTLTIDSDLVIDLLGLAYYQSPYYPYTKNYSTVNVSGKLTAATVTNNAKLNVTGSLTTTTLTNNSTGTIINDGTLTANTNGIENKGSLTNNGSLIATTVTNSGTINNVAGKSLTVSGTLTNNGTIDNYGILKNTSNDTNVLTNNVTINNYQQANLTAINLTNKGTLTNNGTVTVSSSLTNAVNSSLNVVGTLNANGDVENNGTITISGNLKATTSYRTFTNNKTIDLTGELNVGNQYSFTITNNGTVNVEGTSAVINIANNVSGTGTFNMTNVNLSNNNKLMGANINFVAGTSSYNSITSTISGATLTNSKLTVKGYHTLEVKAGLALGNGTLENEGTVIVNEGVKASFGTVTNSNVIKVLKATLNATSFDNKTGAKVNVEGKSDLTATVTGTGTFEMNNVSLDGDTKLTGANINFSNTGNQVTDSDLTDSKVTVNSGAELTLDGAITGDITNKGTLNLTGEVYAGSVTNSGTINMTTDQTKFYTSTEGLTITPDCTGDVVVYNVEGGYYYINSTRVAIAKEVEYSSLQAAIVAAGENGIVTIIAGEITESVKVSSTTFKLGTGITAATINGKLTVDGTAEFNCAKIQFTNVDLSAGATMIIEEGNFEATSFATKGQKAKINVGVDAKLAMEVLRVQHSGASFEFNGEVNIAQVIADNNTNPYTIKLNAHDARLYTPTTGLNVTTDFVDNEYLTTSEGKNHRVSYKTEGSYYRLVNMLVAKVAGESTTVFTTIEEALALGGNLELLWEEGNDPIVMTGVLTNKNATITANSNNDSDMVVDWSKGRLYIGRMAAFNNGPATLTFDGVKFTSVNNTDADYGIFVSGRVKNSEHYNGTLVIKDSEVEISSIYNQNNTEIENSTVTFKTAKGVVVSGINAGDSPTGEMTTSTLDINNSEVDVENITVGERGVGRVLVDVDLVENEFTPDNNGKSQITVSTLNVLANGMLRSAGDIAGTMTNAGIIQLCGGIYTMQPQEGWCAENYGAFQLPDHTWIVRETGGTQSTEFAVGWHWYSTYIDEVTLGDVQKQLSDYASQIKSQVAFTTNFGESWSTGGLNTFSPAEMYMINVTKQGTLEFSGDFVDYSNTDIELQKNWNWIGYPVNIEVNVNVALKNLQPEYGDIIKGKGKGNNGVAYYYGGTTGWIPNITLLPGNGYMYLSNSDAIKTFVYNAIEAEEEEEEEETETRATEVKRWNANINKYPSTMTMVAMVSMDGEVVNGNYEVAAFANGELRGSARPVYVEALDAHMLFLSINGDEVEELTFKYYDVNYGTEYDLSNRINYSTDAVLGSMDEPYMLNLDILNIDEAAANEISIYPNPTTTNVEINLNATCDTVEVFNALGVKVAEYSNVDSIDALETAGVYVIRITNDGNVQNCRLVVK